MWMYCAAARPGLLAGTENIDAEWDNPGRTVFHVPDLADLMPHSGV